MTAAPTTTATPTAGTASFVFWLALASPMFGCNDAGPSEPRAVRETPPTVCEHGLPYAVCARCNPTLEAVYRARGNWCGEHGFAESFCPVCHPEEAARRAAEANAPDETAPDQAGGDEDAPLEPAQIETRFVFLRDTDLERVAGIATEPATRPLTGAAIACPVHIAFDADRLAEVRSAVSGVVRRVRVDLGDHVTAGQPLFDLEASQVSDGQGALARARERLRIADANLTRQRSLREDDVNAARDVELAEREHASASTDVRSAQAFLRVAGAGGATPNGRAVVRAPIAGEVVRRPAVLGTLASPDRALAMIVDTSRMWALCDVREADASSLTVGAHARVEVGGHTVDGEVTWVAAELDERTRTVTARIELANPDGRLRAEQYGRARVHADAPSEGVGVPRTAVQRVGGHEVVFVRVSEGEYHPRVVTRSASEGAEADGLVHVVGRVEVGDAVVTTGAVLLRTEVLPGSIGAGCCEVPGGTGDE